MDKILWKASKETIKNSNLKKYETFLKENYNIKIKNDFLKIYNWSIKNSKLFWNSFWEFSEVKGIKKKNCIYSKEFFKSKFLVNSKINFTENFSRKNT